MLKRYAPGFIANAVVAYVLSIAVSLVGVFVFLVAAYSRLTNAESRCATCCRARSSRRSCSRRVPGAADLLRLADVNVTALQAFGGPVILLSGST